MEYVQYEQPQSELRLSEVLWSLLAQWKAVLIVALLLALALPGAKLFKDMRSYRAAVDAASKQEMAASETSGESSDSIDERVEQVLSTLPAEDRVVVAYVAQEQELAKEQNRYLSDSIWLNANPANQRTLSLKYYVQKNGEHDLLPILDAYNVFLKRPSVVEEIGARIAPEAEIKYINELVSVNSAAVPDSDASDMLLSVDIVLPEGVDAASVGSFIDSQVKDTNRQLVTTVGEHTIEQISSEEVFRYNTVAVDRRQTISNNINSLQNNIKTQRAGLSDKQKSALNEVTSILAEQDGGKKTSSTATVSQADTVEKPSFSKKFALVGFVGGVFAYVLAYLIYLAVRHRVTSAKGLEPFACSRALGEVRWHGRHGGLLGWLLHSKMVERFRWRNLADVESQVNYVSSAIYSVGKGLEAKDLAILTMLESTTADRVSEGFVAGIASQGLTAEIVDVSGKPEERLFLALENAVLVVEEGAKESDVWNVSELCRAYDVRLVGNVFVGMTS